jgi:hypothetical protein
MFHRLSRITLRVDSDTLYDGFFSKRLMHALSCEMRVGHLEDLRF